MKLGLVLAGLIRTGIDYADLAAWAADNGYSSIDVPPDRADGFDVARRAGLEIGQAGMLPPLIVADAIERQASQRQALERLKVVAGGGGKLIGLGHTRVPGLSDEENVELFKQGVTPVAEQAAGLGVHLVMEGYPNFGKNLAISPRLWRLLFAAVPVESVGLCFDPSHLVFLGIDWLRALHEFGSRVYYAHAKDTEIDRDGLYDLGILAGPSYGRKSAGVGWWRYTLPGFGEVDWGKYVGGLRALGYDGALAVEHEDDLWGWRDDLEKAKRGLVIARKYLDLFVS